MLVINLITLIFLLVLLKWLWHNLGEVEKEKKIIFIIAGTTIMFLYTLLIYNISKKGIQYETEEVMNYIKTPLLFLFGVVNGIIILPYVFKKIEKIYNDDIEKKEFHRAIAIVLIIICFLSIFETNYLKTTQQGILNMYKTKTHIK